jgi:hypothetical protein
MALSPMVIMYGANGMSEAMYLCFLLGAARYLMRWTVNGQVRALVWTACYLALAVLTRYEAVAAIAAVTVVVFAVGSMARDHDRPIRERALGGLSDALVVALPPLTAFVAWCVVSWVIVGDAFVQFNSRYGNASILQASGGSSTGAGLHPLVFALEQTFAYAPVGLAIGVGGVVVAWLRRDRRYLALVALAAPLVFSLGAYAHGGTFGLFRYYIPALPLAFLAVALLLHPRRGMRPPAPSWLAPGSTGALLMVFVVVLSSFMATTAAVASARLAPTDQPVVSQLFHSTSSAKTLTYTDLLDSGASMAHAIDKYGLASGSIAMDTFDCGFMVLLNSANPHQFVITSDRDFERIVADPVAFHVPYVLVPDADTGIDAISVAHPGIFNGGTVDGFDTKVIATFHTPACPDYRLIQIVNDQGLR